MALVKQKTCLLNWNDINEQDSSISGCDSEKQQQNNNIKLDQNFQSPRSFITKTISQASSLKLNQKTYINKIQRNQYKLQKNEIQINLQKLEECKNSDIWLFVFAIKNKEETIGAELKKMLNNKIRKNQSGWNVLTTKNEAVKLIKQGIKCQISKNFTIRFIFSTMNIQSKHIQSKSPSNLKLKYVQKAKNNQIQCGKVLHYISDYKCWI